LRVGSAEFIVSQPRIPCLKLAIRFDRPDIVKRLLRTRRTGFYLSVACEGYVAAGDSIVVTVADIVDLYVLGSENEGLLRRAIALA
jgi:MOSC domain-containing protein YiiM